MTTTTIIYIFANYRQFFALKSKFITLDMYDSQLPRAKRSWPVALEVMAKSSVIHLLLTDVILPRGMSGRDVANASRERYPAAGVLYSSGHTRPPRHLRTEPLQRGSHPHKS